MPLLKNEEFVLLYKLNKSKSPCFPYWRYDNFDLEQTSDAECEAKFRFNKNDVYVLKEALGKH